MEEESLATTQDAKMQDEHQTTPGQLVTMLFGNEGSGTTSCER